MSQLITSTTPTRTLWIAMLPCATSKQHQDEATGLLGGGGGAGGSAAAAVEAGQASCPGKPALSHSPSPIDREREKFVSINLGQFEAMKPGKPKK